MNNPAAATVDPHYAQGLARLLDVTRSLAAEIDLEKILDTINRVACEALECERASLYRYDAERNELYTSVVTKLEIDQIRKPADSGITGYVAQHRAVVNVPDPAADPRWNAKIDRRTGFHTRSILAAPLASPHDGSLLGVLQLLNKRGGPFDMSDERLIEAFSQHAAVALDRARLVAELQRRQATEASLAIARDIQRGFMPKNLPQPDGYELANWWFPNEAVGGDYCDVVAMPDGRQGLVIADVSGHGLGPSLLMASVRAALHALLLEHSSTDELLIRLGRSLNSDLQHGRFITMIFAALDPAAHRVEYTNAGHGPALHYHAGSGAITTLEATGLPLGVLDPPRFEHSERVSMQPGDVLLLCTDGIVEAGDEHGRPFGQERLEAVIRNHAAQGVFALVDALARTVSGYYVGETPPDDLTVLAARRLP